MLLKGLWPFKRSGIRNYTAAATFAWNRVRTKNLWQGLEGCKRIRCFYLFPSIHQHNDPPVSNFLRRYASSKGHSTSKEAQKFQLAASQAEGSEVDRKLDDLIFEVFQEKEDGKVVLGRFLRDLEETGLMTSDPRLSKLTEHMKKEYEVQHPNSNVEDTDNIRSFRMDRETFKRVVADDLTLIARALRQQFIIPDFPTFRTRIEEIFQLCSDFKGGKVASYIPQLAQVDPNYWGMSVCTVDGQTFSVGDTGIPFTIQSCSKPFTYAVALHELGAETVHQYVGQEPSGRMFNELVLDYNHKPHNPMVNAGAIIVCSILKMLIHPEMSLAEKFDYTHDHFKRLAGGRYVGFNNAVFLSERAAADRNYALGHYMREHKCFPEGSNLKECLDFYFQCCSIEVNCESSSVIAATVANGGICPITNEQMLRPDTVRDVLSLMHSCGMYDYSGQFAFRVGMPAKSGVSGAILMVIPNVMGIAVWSPPLDLLGNSVRGVKFCQELVEVFHFDKYDSPRQDSATTKIDPRLNRYERQGLNIVSLLFSAASGDVTQMRRHHRSGMNMSVMDYDRRTALHLAAAEGHIECVKYLLKNCNVAHDPVDRWGRLPVDDAEHFGHTQVAEFLKTWASAKS